MKTYRVLILIICLLAHSICAQAAWLWTRETGKWINLKTQPKKTPQEQMEYALSLKAEGETDNAVKEFKKMRDHYPDSPLTPAALFEAAQLSESMGSLYAAHKLYNTLLSNYPSFNKFPEILQNEYDIAMAFYSGKRKLLWKFPILPSANTALEIFSSIVNTAPFSELAPAAKLKTGQILLAQNKYSEADTVFRELLDLYKNSHEAEEALFNRGLVAFSSLSKTRHNTEEGDKAVKLLNEFIETYPDSTMKETARTMLTTIQERSASELYSIAEYYRLNQKSPESAQVYYSTIIHKYPDTYWGRLALERMEH